MKKGNSYTLKLLEAHQGYEQLEDEDGQPFRSIRAFAVARVPFGLGYDPHIILHLQQETRDMLLTEAVAEVQALQTHGSNHHTPSGVDIIKSSSAQGGTSRRYLLARLKRDRPDLAEAYARGAYRSVLVQELTPLEALARAWAKASAAERVQFVREKLTELGLE